MATEHDQIHDIIDEPHQCRPIKVGRRIHHYWYTGRRTGDHLFHREDGPAVEHLDNTNDNVWFWMNTRFDSFNAWAIRARNEGVDDELLCLLKLKYG